jgi:ATP adenylyltransferase
MTRPLWAPWRLEYIEQAHDATECVFCIEAAGDVPSEASLLVHRGEHSIVLLNKFPYSSGHVLAAPTRHVGELAALDDAEALELHRLAVAGLQTLERAYGPDGFNLGWNLGHAAGAGIADHVHLHVVPRWSGDTNFMPVLADVKVLPEHLLATRDRLREAWAKG